MKTALKTLVAGLVILGGTALASAQSDKTAPVMTVTAGQGGYFTLPDTRPQPQPYALTGDARTTRPSSNVWQHTAGPVINVGQSQLVLPASR